MKNNVLRISVSLLGLILTFGILVGLSYTRQPQLQAAPDSVLFLVLVVFTSVAGVPVGGGTASLLPMAIVASYLTLGLLPAAWIAFLSQLLAAIIEPQNSRTRSASAAIRSNYIYLPIFNECCPANHEHPHRGNAL